MGAATAAEGAGTAGTEEVSSMDIATDGTLLGTFELGLLVEVGNVATGVGVVSVGGLIGATETR